MGSVTDLSQNDLGNVIDGTATYGALTQRATSRRKPLVGAYFALVLFMIIYCARPEDWITGLSDAPLAKCTVGLALLALVFSIGHIRRRLPREGLFLFLLVGQLFIAAMMSPVWRGGAFQKTLGFSKVLMIVLMITVAVTTFQRLRVLIFTQAISVSVIAGVAIWKGRLLVGRLEGILGGNYADPNDMALAIVISLPLCLTLVFLSKNWASKISWSISMLVMIYAVFLTGSRGGFLALLAVAAICLWEFAIQGRCRCSPLAILWWHAGWASQGNI
jgi:hypothetical protein